VDWDELMPSDGISAEDTCQLIEQSAVRRILVKSGQSGAVHARNFEELAAATGFPYVMAAHKFATRDLNSLEIDMRKRPTKAALMLAFEEALEDNEGLEATEIGLCFPWRGQGGLHILTCESSLVRVGKAGRFWKLDGVYFLLQHIDSFIQQLGPPEDW